LRIQIPKLENSFIHKYYILVAAIRIHAHKSYDSTVLNKHKVHKEYKEKTLVTHQMHPFIIKTFVHYLINNLAKHKCSFKALPFGKVVTRGKITNKKTLKSAGNNC
jgi:hypothetical protein